MISALQQTDNSVEIALDVLSKAFNPNGRKRREAMRVIKQVLKLAKSRGFDRADTFVAFFRQPIDNQDQRVLRRLLSHLFEFVSTDEFAQMSMSFNR